MSLKPQSIEVLTRSLPKEKIRKRPGKAGMEFSYITPDFVIETLNEAFQHHWNTKIVYQHMHENVAVVGLELSVPAAEEGYFVAKQQFGSCEVTRGLGTGEAFKGAASDALKKCATLLGLGLELYQDDEDSPSDKPAFKPPVRPVAPPAVSGNAPPRPSVPPPAVPKASAVPPPRPVAPPAFTPPAAPAKPSVPGPFNQGQSATATVPRPAAPRAPSPAAPRENPFRNNAAASGPNSTQMNAMTNLASRKGLNPTNLIALANVVDSLGNPVQSFEDLTREQAIEVIKAAQL